MLRRPIQLFALLLVAATAAFAFNPAGRWEGIVLGGDQALGVRYTFAPNGDTLNGSMELLDYGAEFPLLDGTVKADSISFVVDLAGQATLKARGRVAGDSLYLASDFGDGNVSNTVLTRIP